MFIFYKSFLDALVCLPKKSDRWDIVEAICQYAESGEIMSLPPRLMPCFLLIKPLIDNGNKKKRGNPNFAVGKQNPYSQKISITRKKQFSQVEDKQDNSGENIVLIDKSRENKDNSSEIADKSIIEKKEKKENREENRTRILKKTNVDSINNVSDFSGDEECFFEKKGEGSCSVAGEKSLAKSIGTEGNNSNTFVVPTLDEIKAYVLESRVNVDADVFFSFYQSKGWMIGKSMMADWKACINGWHKKSKADNTKNQKYQSRENSQKDLNVLFDDLDDIEV